MLPTFLSIRACLIAIPMFGVTAAMAFSNADTTTGLTFNGAAKTFTGPGGGTVILLTPAQPGPGGSVFTTNAVVFDSPIRFSTFFQFRMTDPGGIGAADGIAFVLQTESATALGGGGGNLDYQGIAPSVAVEFDTFYNYPYDTNANLVAILTGGQMNDTDSQTPYGVTNCQPPTGVFGCLGNGDTWSVWNRL